MKFQIFVFIRFCDHEMCNLLLVDDVNTMVPQPVDFLLFILV